MKASMTAEILACVLVRELVLMPAQEESGQAAVPHLLGQAQVGAVTPASDAVLVSSLAPPFRAILRQVHDDSQSPIAYRTGYDESPDGEALRRART